jgi:hypothetical protein
MHDGYGSVKVVVMSWFGFEGWLLGILCLQVRIYCGEVMIAGGI